MLCLFVKKGKVTKKKKNVATHDAVFQMIQHIDMDIANGWRGYLHSIDYKLFCCNCLCKIQLNI